MAQNLVGPVQNYIHLLDKTLFEGTNHSPTEGELTLNFIDRMEDVNTVTKEMDILINNTELDEKYLSLLLKKINKFYARLRRLDPKMKFDSENYDKMQSLKLNVLKKRNLAMKNELTLDSNLEKQFKDGLLTNERLRKVSKDARSKRKSLAGQDLREAIRGNDEDSDDDDISAMQKAKAK